MGEPSEFRATTTRAPAIVGADFPKNSTGIFVRAEIPRKTVELT
jgi:hypothetical protein